MKYFTKELYEKRLLENEYRRLKVSKEAEMFSEEYYNKLYNELEKREMESKIEIYKQLYPHLEEKIKSLKNPNFVDLKNSEALSQKELDKISDNLKEEYEILKSIPELNIEEEKKEHKRMWDKITERLTEILPSNILNKVADVRVLAFGYASEEVKKDITDYCQSITKEYEENVKKYNEEIIKNICDKSILERINASECEVVSYKQNNCNIIIGFVATDAFASPIKEMTLKNCNVIKQDDSLIGAEWITQEIYQIDTGYELHVLLLKENKYFDYIVKLTDVTYKL